MTATLALAALLATQEKTTAAETLLRRGRPNTREELIPQGPPPNETGFLLQTLATGIDRGFAIAFLPDNRILITEKRGAISVFANNQLVPNAISGVPPVFFSGNGGLLDLVPHPDFATNNLLFFTYSFGNNSANRLAVGRARLVGNTLTDFVRIYETPQSKPSAFHFGSRIVFLPDNTLVVTIGDGGNPPTSLNGILIREFAQDLSSPWGKTVRIDANGVPPADNPFRGIANALPEIFTYGHRNSQGIAIDALTGRIFSNEHGSQGGDEVNTIKGGVNYGWPRATYSLEYGGGQITPHRSLPGMADPILVWTPAAAPSGLAIYNGEAFPAWKGSLLSGGLQGQDIRRITLDNRARVTNVTRIPIGQRVRDVRVGPDGFIYALTDDPNGRLVRVVPNDRGSIGRTRPPRVDR